MKILFSHYGTIDKEGFGRSFMLARGLAFWGHDVTFLTSHSLENKILFPFKIEIRNNVKILSFPEIVPAFMRRTGFGFLSLILKTIYIIGHKFDIYHSDTGHRPSGGIPIMFKKMFVKLTYVTEWWDHFGRGGQYDSKKGIKKITHGFYDLIFEVPEKRIADGVICLSNGMLRRARNLKANKNMCVISGGADTESIDFYPTTDCKNKYNIPSTSLTFGFIGMNKGEIYDIIPFIKAVNYLTKQGYAITWFTTGGYIPRSIKKDLSIGDELTEFGWIDYKYFPEVLSCADCFVLTMREDLKSYTRWPNKVGDYLAAGRPILTNPFGEVAHMVAQNKQFFFTTQFNVECITEKIKEIYKNGVDKNLRYQIRQYAENEISWNQKALQLLLFYEEVRKNG